MAKDVTVPHGIRLVRPPPALEPFVRYYGHRNARLGDTVVVHPVHARAAPILEFDFGDSDAVIFVQSDGRPPVCAFCASRVGLIGMQTHRRGELHIRGTVDGFGIVFQPSALSLLFALPAQEFTDQDFDAEQVFGAIIARFHERLADCRTFEERISVANRFLLQRALAAPTRDGISAAVTDILRGAGDARIPAMAGRAGLGLRQFERRFVQQVGVSPKLFARIARFEAALDRMARWPQGSWTEVAHRFGYYDQMHMVHDFSGFTGETPTRTLQHFEAAFEQQMTAIRTGHIPPSQGERWAL
jgi:AraC-like DNA-binding protein